VTYLPRRPDGARGPGEGAGEGGEAHGGDGVEGMGRGRESACPRVGYPNPPAIAWEGDEPTRRRVAEWRRRRRRRTRLRLVPCAFKGRTR
jgi:hypothetical protein